jgi:hypothetical protein
MEMLFAARGKSPLTLHFTYPIDEIDVERKIDWDKERAKEQKRGKKKVRAAWSKAKNGLGAYFDQNPLAPGQKMVNGEANTRHVIDLLDATTF